MLKTVTIGSATLVQGAYVETLKDGRIKVSVGRKTYCGMPVQSESEALRAETSLRELMRPQLCCAG